MKKPINRFAMILWIVAAIFLVADVPMFAFIQQLGRDAANLQGASMGRFLTVFQSWQEFRTALVGAGQLAALGVLIELVDQIRWDAKNQE